MDFRGHRRTGQALARVADIESTSVFHLARQGRIEVTGESDMLDEFGISVTRLQRAPVNFVLPRGSYWKAVDPRVQDMVATHGIEDDLSERGPIWYKTPAVGAGMRAEQELSGVREGIVSLLGASTTVDAELATEPIVTVGGKTPLVLRERN